MEALKLDTLKAGKVLPISLTAELKSVLDNVDIDFTDTTASVFTETGVLDIEANLDTDSTFPEDEFSCTIWRNEEEIEIKEEEKDFIGNYLYEKLQEYKDEQFELNRSYETQAFTCGY